MTGDSQERKKREGEGLKKEVKEFCILYSKRFEIKNTRRFV